MITLNNATRRFQSHSTQPSRPTLRVDVACPDSRQPAYEAAAGLFRAGQLGVFETSYYYEGTRWPARLAGVRFDGPQGQLHSRLKRRAHEGVPSTSVSSHAWVDAALAIENRAGSGFARRSLTRWRTRRFDRQLARAVAARRPDALLLFSDVGSEETLDACRRFCIPTVLSVVHGDPEEELDILRREEQVCPELFPMYLGDARLDRRDLAWLHERRLREARLADILLVPSAHIASRLIERGVEPERVRVVPYAADLTRFSPREPSSEPGECTFVFAGGISQRKGIGYLLRAWGRLRRNGWRLVLVGAMPSSGGPLDDLLALEGVTCVGRVGHSEMPGALNQADVFVFPSLFEGSAVVTYEALACGLPSVVTREAGSVVRDGVEGLVVPAADINALASALERLGNDPALRAWMRNAARTRAERFTWRHYHKAVAAAVRDAVGRDHVAA